MDIVSPIVAQSNAEQRDATSQEHDRLFAKSNPNKAI
jgi:hypothetical protein